MYDLWCLCGCPCYVVVWVKVTFSLVVAMCVLEVCVNFGGCIIEDLLFAECETNCEMAS